MPIALLTITLAVFAICTTEWGIAGLLPVLSSDLSVSIPAAGLLVTGYALGVAVGGPILAVLTPNVSRKTALLAIMVLFILGQVVCALAPSYEALLAARIVVACGHGLFFGIATIVAAGLLPARPGFAISMMFSGTTMANLLGVPAGAAIGNAFGWRATFWAVAAIAIVAAVAMAILLPPSRTDLSERKAIGQELRALNHQQVYLTYLLIILLITGSVALSTYIVPLLTDVAGVPLSQTPWFLLLLGAGSLIGNFVGGRLSDWKLMPTLIAILVCQAVLQLALAYTSHSPILIGINLFLTGAVGFSFGAHVTTRVLVAAKAAPNLASTLNNTAFNLGIGCGAWLGGSALSAGLAYDQLPFITFGLIGASACVAILSMLLDRPTAALPADA